MGGLSRFAAPMNRRDFLKSLGGMAASAALPNVPGTPDAPLTAGLGAAGLDDGVRYVSPEIMPGFSNGIRTGGYWYPKVYSDAPLDEYMMGMPPSEVKKYLQDIGIGRASANFRDIKALDRDGQGMGDLAWNDITKQWHQVVRMPSDNPNVLNYRYLEPGSKLPAEAADWFPTLESYDDFRDSTELFDSPGQLGNQLLKQSYTDAARTARRQGPDKAEMKDPEYRKRYIEQATRDGLTPGGRPETPRALMDSGLPTGNMAIPGADDAGSLPSLIGRLRRAQKPAATGIMSLAPALLAPQGEEQ